jgi:DNA repair protein RadC
MRGSHTLGIARGGRMGVLMTLYEPVGKMPEPEASAGFVPSHSEDAVAQQLLRPLFDADRETLLIAGFDAFDRLVRLEHIEGDATSRCIVPPQCWRALLDRGIATVIMAHNHPSGAAWPSDADIDATHEAALLLRAMGIDLVDHLIFVAGGHFSFRTAEML